MENVIKVIIADDHPLFREGLRKILALEPVVEVVGEAGDGLQAVEMACNFDCDVLLLDINMPGLGGVEVCKRVKREKPEVGVIALTIHDQEEYLLEMIRGGVSAYLLKEVSPDQLVSTVLGVARGESFVPPRLMGRVLEELAKRDTVDSSSLTRRELDVLELVVAGESNRAIAEKLFISEKTVKNHLHHVFQKLGVADRTQAAMYAVKNKLVKL